MSSDNGICQNPNCGSSYIVPNGDVDDGFCSFQCWEESNCMTPEVRCEELDTHVEEILNLN